MLNLGKLGSIGALASGVPGAPWYSGVVDFDLENGRYAFNGVDYGPDASSALVAASGSMSGYQFTLGPYIFGAELMADPGFDSGVGGAADAPSYAANGDVSQVSGALRAQFTGAASPYRWRIPITTGVAADRCYVAALTALSHVGISNNGLTLNISTNTDLGGSNAKTFTQASLPNRQSVVFAAPFSPFYFGGVMAGAVAGTTRADYDDASLKECYPHVGYGVGGNSFRLSGVAPATVAATQVLLQYGDDSERQRVRFHVTTDYHLHLVVTRNGTQLDDVDLGVLTASQPFVLAASLAPGRIVARLDSNPSKLSVSTSLPGAGILWIGRSFTGEAWTGSWRRFTSQAYEQVPQDVLVTEGDSYMAGAGGVSLVVTAKADGRATVTTAVGGTTLADQLTRMQAKPKLFRSGVFIHWDGSASGNVDVGTAMANYEAIVASLGHSRFVIVVPVRVSQNTGPNNQLTSDIQAALLARWPSNVVNAQAILAARATSPGDDVDVAAGYVPSSLNQGDGHLTSAAMGYVWNDAGGVKSKLTANSW